MNSAKTADTQQKAARVAGFLYLIIIITSILSMILVESKLVVPGDAAATVNNIMANELLFRIGAAYDLIMFASVVILSVALYVILKTVNKNLALLALSWRLAEAILGCVAALSSLIVLLLLNGEIYSAAFATQQLQALVGLFLDVRSAALTLVFVFLSLGTIVFCYLFFKSKYIPRILAAFGIFSFLLMLIGSFVSILLPDYAAILQFAFAPAALFEIVIGLWLLIKGVNVEQWEKRALESA
jgi:hypothetical protein